MHNLHIKQAGRWIGSRHLRGC